MQIIMEREKTALAQEEFGPLLSAYYEAGVIQLAECSGPNVDPAGFQKEFWEEVDAYIPPKGGIFLVRSDTKELLGFGMLKTVEPGIGEMKRLYVRPEARGHRLGNSLIKGRIDASRDMGLSVLRADTWKSNKPMLDLYEFLGFKYVAHYADSATFKLVPQVAPFMVFLELDLSYDLLHVRSEILALSPSTKHRPSDLLYLSFAASHPVERSNQTPTSPKRFIRACQPIVACLI